MSERSLGYRLAAVPADIRRALADRRGASAIEYALIAGSISIVIVGVVSQVGSSVASLFQSVAAVF